MATTKKPTRSIYLSSIFILAVTIGIGIILQAEIGSFNFQWLSYPTNLIVIGVLVLICSLGAFFPQHRLVLLLSGLPFSITLLFTFLMLTIIMGLTPQKSTQVFGSLLSKLGFAHMTASWPFVMTYALTLLSLGLLITRRLRRIRPFSISFQLNHIGLWILLAAAGLGYADQHRFVMYPQLEQGPEWRVYNANKDFLELPIAIELNKFSMESYPAKIAIFNQDIDAAIPAKHPAFFQLEAGAEQITIGDWDIKIHSYLHEAAPDKNNTFRAWPVIGSAPAAQVSVRNTLTGDTKTGWISSGSIKGLAQPFVTLPLDDAHSLVMLVPEPKHFVSDITIYTPDEPPLNALLTVNNPITIGHWKLYQQGYDADAGALSIYSAIELVYDPWIKLIYLGFILLMLGAIMMIWTGRKEKRV